ncbi:hypothetical protein A6B39_01900 [Mannheimia granulomatis]|uniref:hypothetical protein n=1 Tax=Mannheimia granulomatis TaxID=85402 RepID=UPI00159D710D|nr:hypothetical protein [Mannheimia granulomatis]QLB14287.1 hypothetical protein A6B39_01900 [Mannheimia granulomatis]
MEFIKRKLMYLYLNPHKNGFIFLSTIIYKKQIILIILTLIFLIYPIINVVKIHFLEIETKQEIINQTKVLEHQQAIYNTLLEKEKTLNNKNFNLTNINENIQQIAQKNRLQIHNLQWNLEKGKSIELQVVHHSSSIFNFIKELNQIPYLKFNMISLTKSNQERKLELNTILVPSTNKEEYE